MDFQSDWPCGLRRRAATAWLLGSRVRIPLRHGCSSLLFVACCVGSGLCDELITRPEEYYRVCVYNCVWSRNLNKEAVWARFGPQRHRKMALNTVAFVSSPNGRKSVSRQLLLKVYNLPFLRRLSRPLGRKTGRTRLQVGHYIYYCRLSVCDAVYFGTELPKFQRNLLPLPSGWQI
jgi:hypothetical protein